MQLTIKYFGKLTEATNQTQESYLVAPTSTVGDLIKALGNCYPALGAQKFQVAVNRSIAPLGQVLQEGDEVALLPPFSGG